MSAVAAQTTCPPITPLVHAYERGIVCGEMGTYFGLCPFPIVLSSRSPRDVSSSSCVPFGNQKLILTLSCRCRSSCSLRKELRVCSQRNCSSIGSAPQHQWEYAQVWITLCTCMLQDSIWISSPQVCLLLLAECRFLQCLCCDVQANDLQSRQGVRDSRDFRWRPVNEFWSSRMA